MIDIKVTGDFKVVKAWLRKLRRVLTGNQNMMRKLGQRMVKDFEMSVAAGGTHFKSGDAAPRVSRPGKWPKTNKDWQKLRATGPQPLQRTGAFGRSFGYNVLSGTAVAAGSSHIGSRRFNFGDVHYGKRWRWAAPVYNGVIMDEMSPGFQGEVVGLSPSGGTSGYGAGHMQWFSPIIQKREYLALWDDTKNAWWRIDVGGHLGIRT
jgi:phage gpG-like protein